MTEKAQIFLNIEVLPEIIQFKNNLRLNDIFVDCVQWDLLGALMEASYEDCHPPQFFSKLLSVYEEGHFPCGWIEDEWPKGKLVIF